ncbi:hypothetical protein G9A89_001332 [Geosiphon pyriformis]|nr:hypothetical protein G9A89_001332 [Geosiphon pyriformis]
MNNLVFIFTELKLKGKVCLWLTDKFDGVRVFISDLNSGSLGADVLIIMNFFLAKHICKISEVPGWLLSIKLLFKNKLSVSILGLYAGALSVVWFSQAGKINFFIVKAVNGSSFVVLGGDFNENSSQKCASFKKCLELGLVNSLIGSLAIKMLTWVNSRGVIKTINYVFISPNLVNSLVHCSVSDISEYFDTDYQTVFVGLGSLLDTHLFTLRKQVNKDHWKFDVKNASEAKWLEFKDAMAANTTMFSDIIRKIIVLSADGAFKKRWFKDFDTVCNKVSSRFHKLELLVSKLVKASYLSSSVSFASLLVRSMFFSGAKFDDIRSALAKVRKLYHSSKLLESKRAEKSHIRQAITNRIESFELDKGRTIRSVLEHLFCKVVLDHLVVNNKLVLESDLTRKRVVVDDISDTWFRQYQPLDYVFDDAFSGVMSEINFDKLHYKCCNKLVLGLFLVLLNSCLSCELVPGSWKKAWKGVLTNTHSIALIETARKILSKILSDRISLAYSSYDVLCGDNFSVLKSTTTQSPIFAVGLVSENVLKKNRELWLVLQDMWKTYDLVDWEHLKKSLVRIKMCNFGLTDGYRVFDELNQDEVFSLLLWRIFYDSLLCKVKHQKSMRGYRLNSHFVFGSGGTESQTEFSTFLAAGAFVDDTIWYLGIFLSTEGLSRPSLAKAHSNIHFFTNLVLRKVVSDKQFLYLMSANALIRKDLKLKAGLLMDFSTSLISFANFDGILGCLFSHRSHDLQVLCCVSNNFLAGMVCILLDCNLSLDGFLASAFRFCNRIPMSVILGKSLFFKFLPFLWRFGIAFVNQLHDCHGIWWKRLDSRGPVPEWFGLSVAFFMASHSFFTASVGADPLNFCESDDFVTAHGRLFQNLDTVNCRAGAAVFFEDIDLSLGVSIQDLVSSTLAELQAIALALECMPAAHSIDLFLDSQAALDAYRSELSLICPDFCNRCWVERQHIRNVIYSKNLRVSWHKVKGHSSILENDCADNIIDVASLSGWYLLPYVDRHFLLADDGVVFGNFKHFVSSGSGFLASSLWSDVDWLSSFRVWHPDLNIATGFTNRLTADTRTYFMKKRIYNKCYLSVLCLYCGEIEISDHVFFCAVDDSACCQVLEFYMFYWRLLSGLSFLSSVVLQLMLTCASDLLIFLALYKSFVFNEWLQEAITVFHDPKIAGVKITDFMCSLCSAFRNDIWLVCTKHCAFIKKNNLIPVDGSISISVFGSVSRLLPGVIKLLGVTKVFGVFFGFHKSCLFFSGIGDMISVNIVV